MDDILQFDRLKKHLWMNEPNECWMTVRQIDWASVNEWTQWVLNDSLTDWLNIYGWMNPMSVGWMTAAATTTLGYEWWSGRRGLKLRLIRTTRKNSPVNDLRWKNSPQAFPSQDLQYIPHSPPPPNPQPQIKPQQCFRLFWEWTPHFIQNKSCILCIGLIKSEIVGHKI